MEASFSLTAAALMTCISTGCMSLLLGGTRGPHIVRQRLGAVVHNSGQFSHCLSLPDHLDGIE